MIFQERYERFLTACQDISRYRECIAKPVIDRELLTEVGPGAPNDALLSHILAEALLRRIDQNLVESKNIYLQRFDISQIELFYLMGRAYPQVPASHRIANELLAHSLRRLRRAAYLEIGVGKAVQVLGLLQMLAEDSGSLERLAIVALDPNEDNLRDSAEALHAARVGLPFELEVKPVQRFVERCDEAELRSFMPTDEPVVINSAYSIHHTVHRPRDTALRTQLFKNLASLHPAVFTLVEPNSNHDTEQLTKRFHSCWEHFGTVFDLIDEAPISADERFVIKEKFIGREIRDIFGTSDAFRCERHEPFESWLLRFAKAGFRPTPAIPLSIELPAYCTMHVSDGLVRLGYRDLPLIAVFAYEATR